MGNGSVQGFLGGAEQLMHFGRDGPDRNTGGVVAEPAIFDDANIELHDIPVLNDAAGPANAMHDFFIQGDANLARKSLVA